MVKYLSEMDLKNETKGNLLSYLHNMKIDKSTMTQGQN